MSDDQVSGGEAEWRPPIGPVDPPDHPPECAAVIAEVWTLLDGECTTETRDRLRHHLEDARRACVIMGRGADQEAGRVAVQREKRAPAPAGEGTATDQPDHDHSARIAAAQTKKCPADLPGPFFGIRRWDACRDWLCCACGHASYDHAWP